MADRLQAWADRLKEIDPLKALVFSLFAATFAAGTTYAGLDNRISNAAVDVAAERASRKDGERATGDRISRGFDKVLGRLDSMQKTMDDRATADHKTSEQTAHELGLLRGLYERNYGDVSRTEP